MMSHFHVFSRPNLSTVPTVVVSTFMWKTLLDGIGAIELITMRTPQEGPTSTHMVATATSEFERRMRTVMVTMSLSARK